MDEVFHPHVLPSYQTVGNIFSSCKTIPPYLQYDKELFASCSCHTPLTGLSDPGPSPGYSRPGGGGGGGMVYDLNSFPAATLPEWERQLVEQW